MEKGKLNLSSHLNEHTYPAFLMKFPFFIHAIYAWNRLVLQRNWIVGKALREALKQLKPDSQILDAGCGEGLFLLRFARQFSSLQFKGIDKSKDHFDFCNKYKDCFHLENTSLSQQNLESPLASVSTDLLICIGTLQYINNDFSVLKKFYNTLKVNGKIIIYVPLNGRFVLSAYRMFFVISNHYEISQNRKRIYSQKEILGKMRKAGFEIEKLHFTYGLLGIIGHEIYSLILLGLGSGKWFAWIFAPVLFLFLPIILCLKVIDFFIKKQNGNGMLIIAKKT